MNIFLPILIGSLDMANKIYEYYKGKNLKFKGSIGNDLNSKPNIFNNYLAGLFSLEQKTNCTLTRENYEPVFI